MIKSTAEKLLCFFVLCIVVRLYSNSIAVRTVSSIIGWEEAMCCNVSRWFEICR